MKDRIWEMSSSGSGLHEVMPGWHGAAECCGKWTPDGKLFLFISDGRIWALDERRGVFRRPPAEPIQMTQGPIRWGGPLPGKYFPGQFWGRPVPSEDGSRIFALGLSPRGELSRFDSKTKQFQPFLGGISAQGVSYSKDGKSIAYVSYPEGILWKANRDGSNPLQLTDPPLQAFMPRWSPDGKRISFQGISPSKPWTMYIVAADGGDLEEIKPWPGDPGWSPDGNSMVFSTPLTFDLRASIKSTIQTIDLRSRQISTLPDSEGFYSPRWSPDGRYIAALRANSNSLHVFDLSSRKWRELGEVQAAYPNWSRDSKYIYFRSRWQPPWLCRFRIADAKLDRIASLEGIERTGVLGWPWVGLAPDGSPLVLRDAGTQEIYVLDVDLP